jgi:hypothetical protein
MSDTVTSSRSGERLALNRESVRDRGSARYFCVILTRAPVGWVGSAGVPDCPLECRLDPARLPLIFVRVFQSFSNLLGDRQGFVERHRPVADPLGQRRHLDQLHHQSADAVALFQSVDGGDVGMVQQQLVTAA